MTTTVRQMYYAMREFMQANPAGADAEVLIESEGMACMEFLQADHVAKGPGENFLVFRPNFQRVRLMAKPKDIKGN